MGQQGITLLLSILNTPGFTGNDTLSTASIERMTGDEDNGKHTADGQPIRIQLPTSLVVRESCGSGDHISITSTSDQSKKHPKDEQ